MLLCVFFFALSNVFIEPLSKIYPLGEMIFLRSLILIVPMGLGLGYYYKNEFHSYIASIPFLGLARQGFFSSFVLFFLFYGFSNLSMPIATTLCFSETFILTLFGILFLKEKNSLKQWIILIVGFSGIVLITFKGKSIEGASFLASLSCVVAITLDSWVLVSLKKLIIHHSLPLCLFFYVAFCGLSGLFFAPFEHWIPLQRDSFLALTFFSLSMSGAQLFLFLALRNEKVSLLSILIYTQIIWALLFTFLTGGFLPSLQEWLGIALIIGAGVSLNQGGIFKKRSKLKKL